MISIVIGTYNAADTLERCLQSIVAQTSSEWEVLASDGGSNDDTLAIFRRYSQHLAYLVSEPDEGVYQAWNRVIPHANGDWVIFLGADDQLASPHVIADIESSLGNRQITPATHDFVYGVTELVDQGEVVERLGLADTPDQTIPRDREVTFAHTGLLHSRSVLTDLSLFDESYRSAGDYEFLLRATLLGRGRLARIEQTTAKMATGGMSNSATGRKRHYAEMIAARAQHSLTTPLAMRLRYAKACALAIAAKLLNDRQMANFANLYRTLRGKPRRKTL